MYKYHAAALTILGRLQEDAGRLVGSKNMQSVGYGRQMAGRARIAIGEADRLIRRCKGNLPLPLSMHPGVTVKTPGFQMQRSQRAFFTRSGDMATSFPGPFM
jgi:hypothetical protein